MTLEYTEVGEALAQSLFACERVCCLNFRGLTDSYSRNRKSQTVENLFQSLKIESLYVSVALKPKL